MKKDINKYLVIGIEVFDDIYFQVVKHLEELEDCNFSEFYTTKVNEDTIEREFKLNIGWELLFKAFGNQFYTIKPEEAAATESDVICCINGKYIDSSIYHEIYKKAYSRKKFDFKQNEARVDGKVTLSLELKDEDLLQLIVS